MKKKYISLFLALVLMFSLAVPTTLASDNTLYDDLMATTDVADFMGVYQDATMEALQALTTAQITDVVNHLNVINVSGDSMISNREDMVTALMNLDNAPDKCAECGTLGGHADGCALTPTPAPTQEPTPTPEAGEPTPTPEAGDTPKTLEETLVTPEPTCTCEGTAEEKAADGFVHAEGCPLYRTPTATACDKILAAENTEDLYFVILDYMMNEPDTLLALTTEEIDAIRERVAELDPEGDDTDTGDILDTLNYLPNASCTECGFVGEHECYGKVELPSALSSGLETGTNYFYATEENVTELFSDNRGTTTINYNSESDVIQLKATAADKDPNVWFTVKDLGLAAADYPYIVVSYKASKAASCELFLLTSTNTSATGGQSVGFGTVADGKFHTAVLNASSKTAWSGTIEGFRFDYFGTVASGDLFEIDAIAFCKTQAEVDYFTWERNNVRNNQGVFLASPHMATLFYNFHNCKVGYDASKNSVVLTAQHDICVHGTGHTTSDMLCDAYEPKGAFDSMSRMRLPQGIPDDYKYLVLTYMTPNNLDDIIFSIEDKYPQKNTFWYKYLEDGIIYVNVYPQTTSGGESQAYNRNFAIRDSNVYYSNYINLEDEIRSERFTEIRIDPFALHYTKSGSQLYISAAIFCKTLKEAEDIIGDQLDDLYPYNYELVFDDNVADSDPYQVSGMPNPNDFPPVIRSEQNTHVYTLPTSNPTRANYTFKGWAETTSGTPVTGKTYTVNGVEGEKVIKTLYAIWEEHTVNIAYQAVGTGGTVTPTSETVAVVSGTAGGSTAAVANENYEFLGWYSDAACTSRLTTDATYTPNKTNGLYKAATYYAKFVEKDVTLNYAVVGPVEGCGTVTPGSETLKMLTGTASGSTAAPASNVYKFVGWYDNQACTGDPISTDAKYVPTKADGASWVTGTTWYAKFEYNLTSLTITKSGINESKDTNQTTIYNVYHMKDNRPHDVCVVTIHGNDSVVIDGLTVGETYKVMEQTLWSWRYTNTNNPQDIVLKPIAAENVVSFVNDRTNDKWLSGDNFAVSYNGSMTRGEGGPLVAGN